MFIENPRTALKNIKNVQLIYINCPYQAHCVKFRAEFSDEALSTGILYFAFDEIHMSKISEA